MKKILILEDDIRVAMALAIRLEAAGYEVQTAPNGLQGLQLALEDRPDLILMDIWMPVGIGFSVAQRLQNLGLATIPIVFMTASKIKGLKEAAMAVGGAGFFEKPYDPQVLLEAIARHFSPEPAIIGEGTQPFAIPRTTYEDSTHHRG